MSTVVRKCIDGMSCDVDTTKEVESEELKVVDDAMGIPEG